MYAVVQLGNFQFKVSEGDVIETDRLSSEKGKKVDIEKVLLFADGQDIRVGQPLLKDVKVTAEVVDHTLGEKKISFKDRVGKSSVTKKGHRQKLTALSIAKISAK
jgi:large subunit ribosomal protein L21